MAKKYILLNNSDDSIVEEADSSRFRKTGVPPILKSEKGMRWLELVVVDPVMDVDKVKRLPLKVKEGPVISISDTTYTRTFTIRDKTAEELNKDRSEQTDSQFETLKPLLMALNDGSFVPDSDYTVDQMKAKLKALL
jgi:hypothetical protein